MLFNLTKKNTVSHVVGKLCNQKLINLFMKVHKMSTSHVYNIENKTILYFDLILYFVS